MKKYLCVFCSSQYLFLSSSSMSCNLNSKAPLKGMTIAPGSWASTHSLIFANLMNNRPQDELFQMAKKCDDGKINICDM